MRKLDALTSFARVMKIPDRIPLKDRRRFSALYFISVLCGVMHIVFILLFHALEARIMFYYNFGSVLIWIAILWMLFRYEAYELATLLGTVEVAFHQYLAVICVGWAAGFQYFILATVNAPFLMFSREKPRSAIGSCTVICLSFFALDFFFKNSTPIYSITAGATVALNAMCILLVLAALAIFPYLFVRYVYKAEDKADREFERAESLLLNILPAAIAERLKADPHTIADGFESVTVLFCDIVDFTKLAGRLSPAEVVSVLNELFSRFDLVAERFGLEKIKTIGDAYMVASGIPERRDDHAPRVADFALAIQAEITSFNAQTGYEVAMRIGINSGPVVAGVIGRKKFIYDLWGDAVNTASRMESHGLPGRIQVTEGSYELLKGDYEFESRGLVEVKGKGLVPVWLLNGRKVNP